MDRRVQREPNLCWQITMRCGRKSLVERMHTGARALKAADPVRVDGLRHYTFVTPQAGDDGSHSREGGKGWANTTHTWSKRLESAATRFGCTSARMALNSKLNAMAAAALRGSSGRRWSAYSAR
jgi:hypothetical protein